MHQRAEETIRRTFSPSFLKSVYRASSKNGLRPDVAIYSLYAIQEESEDFYSTLKTADIYFTLHEDPPLVNSGFNGERPVHARGEALRGIGIDVTDDDIMDADTFMKLGRAIEEHYKSGALKATA